MTTAVKKEAAEAVPRIAFSDDAHRGFIGTGPSRVDPLTTRSETGTPEPPIQVGRLEKRPAGGVDPHR